MRRAGRALATTLVVVLVALAVAGVVLHHAGSPAEPVLLAASFAMFGVALAVPALALALMLRRPLLAIVAAVLVAIGVWTYLPQFTPSRGPDGGTVLGVYTQNLEFGGGDARQVVEAVRAHPTDEFVAVELTSEAPDRLRAEGLERVLPFSTVLAEPGADGIGVWSRYPIAPGARQPGFRAGVVTTGLATPAGPVTMVAAHPLLPLHNAAESAAEAERLRGVLGSLPGPAPVVVAGDFNMTWDHTRFRALRSLGYVDSTEGGGDGPVPTWPHGRRLPGGLTAPPVIGIDHVLARGAARIGDTSTVEVAGTDHLDLRARVALPAGRDAPGGR